MNNCFALLVIWPSQDTDSIIAALDAGESLSALRIKDDYMARSAPPAEIR
jgi:hypothetical protein